MKDLRQNLENLTPQQKALLAQRLAQKRAATTAAPKIAPRETNGPAPLSFSQWRLWFLDRLENRNSGYNVYRGARLSGPLDAEALRRSLTEIVRRHAILRTTFPEVKGEPQQVVAPAAEVKLAIVDLTRFPETEREQHLLRLATWESKRLFNLASGPLLRSALVRVGPEEHVLLLTTHHIAADGWSVGILFSELAAIYDAFVAGKPSPLPEPPLQFADFAAWQREWLQGDTLRQHIDYWKQQLDGAPPALDLPTDRPREDRKGYDGARHFLQMPRTLLDGFNALSRQEGSTLFMAVLAAFNVLLARYSAQEDVVVGSPIAGRTRPELEGLIGCFSNTLVLRTRLSGSPTFRELLRRVREVALGAFAHQDMPFDKLVEELHPPRLPHRTPLFQVNFRLLTTPQPPVQMSGLRVQFLEVDNQMAKFDLAVELAPRDEGFTGYIEYFTDLYNPETIEQMAADLQATFSAVLAQPDVPLPELNIPLRLAVAPVQRKPAAEADLQTVQRSAQPVPNGASPAHPAEPAPPSAKPARRKGPPVYHLRKATARDAAFIYRLRKITLEESALEIPGWTEGHREALYMEFDVATHQIIVFEGQDVGALGLVENEEEIYIANLHLLPEFQKYDIGRQVGKELVRRAYREGKKMTCQVFKNNRARHLFQRMGGDIVAETEHRYIMRLRPPPPEPPAS
jgi:GNAT superfamily N-acetyltransferase